MWAISDFVLRPKHWGPPTRQGLGSHYAHIWAFFHFVPRAQNWGPTRRQGFANHRAHMWTTFDYVPVQSIGDPRHGMDSLATVITCGPPPAVLGGPNALHERNQKWPTCGHNGYVTRAVSGVPVVSIGDP